RAARPGGGRQRRLARRSSGGTAHVGRAVARPRRSRRRRPWRPPRGDRPDGAARHLHWRRPSAVSPPPGAAGGEPVSAAAAMDVPHSDSPSRAVTAPYGEVDGVQNRFAPPVRVDADGRFPQFGGHGRAVLQGTRERGTLPGRRAVGRLGRGLAGNDLRRVIGGSTRPGPPGRAVPRRSDMVSENTDRLAVLIDADNAQAAMIEGLLAEVAKYGTAHVKRAYGDWTGTNLRGWKEHLLAQSIQPVQQFAYTSGKNATDAAMVIDAMDLLYSDRFDGFCLVSSDSDFTRLAARIR